MAVVVKEASKTPLAIAALADNMAKTYLQYAQNETSQAQWEQEAIWRNQDRQREQEEISRLGAMAEKIGGMDDSVFVGGELGKMGAVNAAYKGADFADYLSQPTGENAYNPYDSTADNREHWETTQYWMRQNGQLPPDPMADFRWRSMYNRPRVTTDAYGIAKFAYDPLTMQGLGSYNTQGEYTPEGGSGQTTYGAPEGTGTAPSFANEAAARAARDRGEISAGQIIFINGQQFKVDPY